MQNGSVFQRLASSCLATVLSVSLLIPIAYGQDQQAPPPPQDQGQDQAPPPSYPPQGSLGIIQHTIGSSRFLQLSMHLSF